ncbi:MAG: UDP-glucose--hexose-1-phosphate uridylyltransferase [Clostridiales bacterium]|nr:UDP-glucose--hexose-1-phosphate uridylyltransferase [Clostridiales bacterium]
MVIKYIDGLVAYGISKNLIKQQDETYARNRILELLRLQGSSGMCESAFERQSEPSDLHDLHELLSALTGYASENGLCTDTDASRGQFSSALMGLLAPPPSVVSGRFQKLYKKSPEAATDYFYEFCQDVNYISRYRTALDVRWKTMTEYGELDITINLSKPEKDPRDIAAAVAAPVGGYPACLLCAENEGYAGSASHPARHCLRIVPVQICDEAWGFQYSPYTYYNEHCIVLNMRHTPMVIDRLAFDKLLSFVAAFPHYFVGSNADLPIVGGSILSHEHFQGGRYVFPMERAPVEHSFQVEGYGDVDAGTLRWPMSVIRIAHSDPGRLAGLADRVLNKWRNYSDPSAGIFACTGSVPHNTVTPIARFRNGKYEFDLALRNNITTAEHPLGVFHPHAELHNIKKENIGLIEAMGLAVLPPRLHAEMETLKSALLSGQGITGTESIAKHTEWVESWKKHYNITPENADCILRSEIGKAFAQALAHSGVFKRDAAGKAAFARFVEALGN